MKKYSWPWLGSTEHEMGSMSKSFSTTDQAANQYDTFVPEKSVTDTPAPSYSEGKISPIEGDGESLSVDPGLESSTLMISNDDDEELLKVECKLAKTIQEQIMGLQSYNKLEKHAGLLFPYKIPADVVYHMGSVKYPIDILFIDDNFKIKKIYSNIQPGSLSTFGCANVKFVLEINGGLSKEHNIDIGNKISFNRSILKKIASFKQTYDMIYCYSFDQNILESPEIILNEIELFNEDNIALDIYNNIFTPGKSVTASINTLSDFKNCNITKNSSGGLKNFLKNSKETYDIYSHIKNAFLESNSLIVFATALPDSKKVFNIFVSKLESLYGAMEKFASISSVSLDAEANHINVIETLRNQYPNTEICLAADVSLTKKAGVPVPDSIKEQAKKVLKFLENAELAINKSLDAVKQNLTEYEKIQTEPDKIKSTQGQFHQSAKRNIEMAKKYLFNIRDAIKMLNKIKDASTTVEIIESLAGSSQVSSDAIQEVFDLINYMDTPDFIMMLGEKTNSYDKACEDMVSTIERAQDYINKNILGILVLSK